MTRTVSRQTLLILLFLLIVTLFVTFFRMGIVRGVSMSPTFSNGQVVLVLRRGLIQPTYHQGDVVLLRQNRDVIIKRIFLLPGDTVPEGYPYLRRFIELGGTADYYEQQPVPDSPMPRLTVPEGYMVVLGDNPQQSDDSRFFGPVPMRDILGVVVRAPAAPYVTGSAAPPTQSAQRAAPVYSTIVARPGSEVNLTKGARL